MLPLAVAGVLCIATAVSMSNYIECRSNGRAAAFCATVHLIGR